MISAFQIIMTKKTEKMGKIMLNYLETKNNTALERKGDALGDILNLEKNL